MAIALNFFHNGSNILFQNYSLKTFIKIFFIEHEFCLFMYLLYNKRGFTILIREQRTKLKDSN